jgi:hypothetical protein
VSVNAAVPIIYIKKKLNGFDLLILKIKKYIILIYL